MDFRHDATMPEFHCVYTCTIAKHENALEVLIEAKPLVPPNVVRELDAFYGRNYRAYLTLLGASYVPRIIYDVTRALRSTGLARNLPRLARPTGPPPLVPPYSEEELLYAPTGLWVKSFSGDVAERVERARLMLPRSPITLDQVAAQLRRRFPGTAIGSWEPS